MCGPAVRIRGSVETARAYSAKRTQQLSDAGVAEVVGNGEGREAVLSFWLMLMPASIRTRAASMWLRT